MQPQPGKPRSSSVLASVLAAAGIDPSLCYRPLGAPVTITSAAVASSPLIAQPASPSPGQPSQPAGSASYGLTVAVPAADVAAVTAVITRAYDSQGAIDISVAGKTWAAPEVIRPFPGRQFQIVLPRRSARWGESCHPTSYRSAYNCGSVSAAAISRHR
jgi:hypothetical protein